MAGGQYSVRVNKPLGWYFTTRDAGDDTLDSDLDPATGRSDTFTLDSSNPVAARDAGVYQTAMLGGRAWEDMNGNGWRDGWDPPLAGRTVRLLNAAGSVVATATTAGDGSYVFSGQVPGSYSAEIDLSGTSYRLTLQDEGADDMSDSDADPATGWASASLFSGQMTGPLDFGLYRPAGIAGRSWLDSDTDGIQDAGETGLANVLVTLYAADGRWVASVLTDAAGNYRFDNVAPGTYFLRFSRPAGEESSYDFTLPHQGAPNVDSDAEIDGLVGYFSLLSGDQDLLRDAGYTARSTS